MAGAESRGSAPRSAVIPTTHLTKGGWCSGSESVEPRSDLTPASVSADPLSVAVVWAPGYFAKSCKAALVRGGSRVAVALASDVDSAPFEPKADGVICPAGDDASATLYFAFTRGRSMERVDVALTGCPRIYAPSAGARSPTTQFRTDLRTLAPPEWTPYSLEKPNRTLTKKYFKLP